MGNWQNFQITTPEEVKAFAKYYAHHNVAVVGKRGVGRMMFLDDDSGVAKRIEEESGHKIPQTYTVASRPDSNPLKRHFYFFQTEYSFKRFAIFVEGRDPWKSKNVNRRDTTRFELSRTGLKIHPTIYDLKGIGGGSFVVAAGSMREPDALGRVEIYTCIDNGPVVPIPDWLVDWFVKDIQKYNAAKAKEKAEKLTERLAKQRTLKAIAEEDVYDFLRWRAHDLVGLGLVGAGLENALTCLARADCDGGETFVSSEQGKEMIHKIAFSNWSPGVATWFYRTGELKSEVIGGHIMLYRELSKQEATERIITTFPDKLSAAEAFEKIAEGLSKDDYPYDRQADKSMVCRARKEAGFAVEGRLYWVRTEKTGVA